MNLGLKRVRALVKHSIRWHCGSSIQTYKCKLLVVGAGTGGCSVAWRFSRKLRPKDIILLEPSDVHYYQPYFALVAAGIKEMKNSYRSTYSVVPPGITFIQDRAEKYDPCENLVYTRNGNKIFYEFLVIAVGIQNDYDKIAGLKQALDDSRSAVSTIYSPKYCTKTWRNIQQFTGGHAVFTYPLGGGKCPGAVLKIMFLAEDYWRRESPKELSTFNLELALSMIGNHKIRYKTSISFNTSNDTIFGVPKFARALSKMASERDIITNYGANLVEVTSTGVVFQRNGTELVNLPYNILHVSPPMAPPLSLTNCQLLVNEAGYLDVNQYTLQHNRFPNVFGLGDCTSTPNSKTAAAIGPQSAVLEKNLSNFIAGKKLKSQYNGYGACPLLTSYNKGILAEFIYDKKLRSTFPFDQSKQRRLFYRMNVHLFPFLYWRCLLKGKYDGPERLRKWINPTGRI